MNDFPDDTAIEPIAIVGMACRFPGAPDLAAYWRNLQAGVEAIRFFSEDELRAAGVAESLFRQPGYVAAHGKLDGVENFDAEFFGFSPREAEIMDPQHRVFLECAWSAIEHAGHDPQRFGERCGVIAGVGFNSYLLHNILPRRDLASAANFYSLFIANDKDFLPTRVSYKLNLRGPSLNVNTACSSSLVAVHLACQQLWSYQCEAVLAGGVALQIPQDAGYLHQQGGIASADGHCRAFDEAAGGTVTGSGAGVVVLKRLSDALAAGDTIHALIRGSACNNDGSAKAGFTAPSIAGQAAVIAEAQAMAEIAPDSIGYVEAHGTGTALGDPIEIAALTQAFGGTRRQYCLIGSVKTNIGHLDTAAGIAGLIKAVLVLRHEAIPASLHYRAANPRIDFAATPFRVCTQLTPWPRGSQPRRAAVSSFGIGGTNAHVVLEEAPAVVAGTGQAKPRLFHFSARTPAALQRLQARLAEYLENTGEAAMDIAWTLAQGRSEFAEAGFAVADDHASLAAALRGTCRSGRRPARAARIAFLFPGQGAQQAGAGRQLYADEPVFRAALDDCAAALIAAGAVDVRPWLVEAPAPARDAELEQTRHAQPALFALSYALAALWRERGIEPAAVLGHSSGEYAGAVCAGVLSLADGARALAARAQLMAELPPGAMAAVGLSESELRKVLIEADGELAIAAVNAPALCTVAGSSAAVDALGTLLTGRGVFFRRLRTAHAFHSPAVTPLLERFRAALAGIRFQTPRIPFYSAVLGRLANATEICDGELWVRQIREPVLFAPALAALLGDGFEALVEAGPGKTLATLARQAALPDPAPAILAGISADGDERRDLLDALGQLWLAGATPRWDSLFDGETPRRVALPTYPFEPARHWLEPVTAAQEIPVAVTGGRRDPSDWFYLPTWTRAAPRLSAGTVAAGQWLVFARDQAFDQQLVAQLADAGAAVTVARADGGFAPAAPGNYTLRPDVEADYDALLDQLEARQAYPDRILFGWTLDADSTRGFDAVLRLTRALARRGRPVAELVILAQAMAAVQDDDALDPHQATLISPILVIPSEFPGLACRGLDLPTPLPAPAAIAAELLATNPIAAPLTAWRGRHRWLPGFEALSLPEPGGEVFRRGGTYLITGGIGGMGLLIAAHLAKTVQARLILTSRRSLPPPEEWERLAALHSGNITQALPELAPFLAGREAAIAAELAIRTIEDRPGLLEAANRLAAAHALEYLKKHGLARAPGSRLKTAEVYAACQVLPEFERLVGHFLNILAEDSWLRRDGDDIEILRDFVSAPSAAELHAGVCRDFPGLAAQFEMLAGCVAAYPDALSGRIPAISVLYPDGARYVIAEAAARTEEHDNNRVYRTLLADLLQDLARRVGPGRPLRIVEVGGGNAIMTGLIAERLRGLNVEYYFTDIGRSFVQAAETKARELGYDFIRFATFDISRDPAPQGFAPGSFDAVIGLDVVHATQSLRTTVTNLRQLLVPGGLMCLVESARTQRWNNMVWGLAEGWWYSQDSELRNPHSPLLSTARWETALDGCGFTSLLAFPQQAEQRARTDCSLIVAQNSAPLADSAAADNATLAALLDIRRDAADLLVCQADVADPAQMSAAVVAAEARCGAIHGVIHAAAVESKAVIAAREEPFAAAEMRPKAEGALVLDQVFRNRPLDFMVLCSSITAVVGGAGQVGYCAANAFLDAFAEQRSRERPEPTVSIAWGRWQGVGLARDFESWHASRTGQQLLGGMTPEEGIEALRRILYHRIAPRVAVMTAEWRPEHRAPSSSGGDARAVDQALSAPGERNAGAPHEEFSGSATERQLAAIWRQLLGTSRFDRHTPFPELGGDSLVGIQMIARIKEQLGVQLPIHSIFDCPTIAALAERIQTGEAGEAPMEEGSL